jgi:hypothetical protein
MSRRTPAQLVYFFSSQEDNMRVRRMVVRKKVKVMLRAVTRSCGVHFTLDTDGLPLQPH